MEHARNRGKSRWLVSSVMFSISSVGFPLSCQSQAWRGVLLGPRLLRGPGCTFFFLPLIKEEIQKVTDHDVRTGSPLVRLFHLCLKKYVFPTMLIIFEAAVWWCLTGTTDISELRMIVYRSVFHSLCSILTMPLTFLHFFGKSSLRRLMVLIEFSHISLSRVCIPRLPLNRPRYHHFFQVTFSLWSVVMLLIVK